MLRKLVAVLFRQISHFDPFDCDSLKRNNSKVLVNRGNDVFSFSYCRFITQNWILPMGRNSDSPILTMK